MHDCVRRWQRLTGGRMLRLVTGTQMALIACFGHSPTPLWIAKLSHHETGHQLLRQERDALAYLQPWAEPLGIPQGWDWAESNGVCCLLQQGMAGICQGEYSHSALRQALDWLVRFQRLVPPPHPITLPALIAQDWQQSQQNPDPFRLSHRLLDWLRHQPAAALPVTVSHGDFWIGNLLFTSDKIHVVDWPCMGSRPPLEDMLTLLLKAESRPSISGRGDLESFLQFWHRPWTAASWRQSIRRLGWTAETAAQCFYLYLARRIRWESGLEGQFRSPAERLAANMRWSAIVEWLSERQFPPPFSTIA